MSYNVVTLAEKNYYLFSVCKEFAKMWEGEDIKIVCDSASYDNSVGQSNYSTGEFSPRFIINLSNFTHFVLLSHQYEITPLIDDLHATIIQIARNKMDLNLELDATANKWEWVIFYVFENHSEKYTIPRFISVKDLT